MARQHELRWRKAVAAGGAGFPGTHVCRSLLATLDAGPGAREGAGA
jgi:hypothetical protein